MVKAMGLFTEDALGLPFGGLDLLLVALDEVLARGLPLVHFQACSAKVEGDIIDTDNASEGVDVDDILIRIAVDALHVPRVRDTPLGVEDILSSQGALDADGDIHTTHEDMPRGVQDVFDRVKLSPAKVGWEGVGLNEGVDGATELDLFTCDGVVDASSVLAVDELRQQHHKFEVVHGKTAQLSGVGVLAFFGGDSIEPGLALAHAIALLGDKVCLVFDLFPGEMIALEAGRAKAVDNDIQLAHDLGDLVLELEHVSEDRELHGHVGGDKVNKVLDHGHAQQARVTFAERVQIRGIASREEVVNAIDDIELVDPQRGLIGARVGPQAGGQDHLALEIQMLVCRLRKFAKVETVVFDVRHGVLDEPAE